jgi:hypothetical protein
VLAGFAFNLFVVPNLIQRIGSPRSSCGLVPPRLTQSHLSTFTQKVEDRVAGNEIGLTGLNHLGSHFIRPIGNCGVEPENIAKHKSP